MRTSSRLLACAHGLSTVTFPSIHYNCLTLAYRRIRAGGCDAEKIKMKIIKYALGSILGLILLLGVVALLLPDSSHVERSVEVDANPSTVFTVLNGFRSFNQWSPWHERDPNAEYGYAGPSTGVGATMTWKSDQDDVGSGSQEIIESEPYSRIRTLLDFGAQGNAYASFSVEASGQGTKITWGMDTKFGHNLVARYFGLFLDKWVGRDYEKGLSNLKAFVAELPGADFSDVDPQTLEVEPVHIAYVSGSTPNNPTAITAALAVAYLEVTVFMELNGLTRGGPPLAVSRAREHGAYEFDAAIPLIEETAESPDSKVLIGTTYGGAVARGTHIGPYRTLSTTHAKVAAFVAASGLAENGDPWDAYITDPGTTEPENLVTHVYYPVR